MSNRFLYIAWGVMYAICAGLGFIPNPQGVATGLLVFFSLVFFLPPAILLYRAIKADNKRAISRLRAISLTWLIVTTCAICVNIMSVASTLLVGRVVYYILILVTAPMICGQSWILSIFLWALLLTISWKHLKKK